jgi:hypothetical protein
MQMEHYAFFIWGIGRERKSGLELQQHYPIYGSIQEKIQGGGAREMHHTIPHPATQNDAIKISFRSLFALFRKAMSNLAQSDLLFEQK